MEVKGGSMEADSCYLWEKWYLIAREEIQNYKKELYTLSNVEPFMTVQLKGQIKFRGNHLGKQGSV